ncbi:MAG: EAL domain-containing protein [Acidimicrobiales bacterium]|nr:EAL domain-containing protein [Acidimicrobiales bacterium]
MTSTPPETTTEHAFHRLVADGARDLHVVTAADATVRFASAASRRLFGWEPAEIVGSPQALLVHPDDTAVVGNAHRQVLFGPTDSVTSVWRFRCANGTYLWTEVVSRAVLDNGEPLVVSTIRDISDRHQTELELRRLATTDPLTGTANRTVFMDRLEHALSQLERRVGVVAVFFVDLDQFKAINDTVGHLVGDAVLLQTAERLRSLLRPHDTLARLGGDEFAIVVENLSSPDEVAALGERIVAAGRAPFTIGNEGIQCTISVGTSATADARHGAEALLEEADLALYRAKGHGRDRCDQFDDALRTRAVGRLGIERMLRHAIDEDRQRVVYQPIIDLQTGAPVAAEALIRIWDAERSTLIDAEAFIDVAEQAGLLVPLDGWVLAEAIGQAARWCVDFEGREFEGVAVNLTSRHLSDTGFAESVLEQLAASGLPTSALQIEVTERVVLESSNSALSGLSALRDQGVKVGLDDFGTGYSSLSHLRLFPLDFVKIDRTFVHALDRGGIEPAIVKAIIDIGHALDMTVTGEGVETQRQLDQLASLGCDRAQGFHLARPGPAMAVEDSMLRPGLLGSAIS